MILALYSISFTIILRNIASSNIRSFELIDNKHNALGIAFAIFTLRHHDSCAHNSLRTLNCDELCLWKTSKILEFLERSFETLLRFSIIFRVTRAILQAKSWEELYMYVRGYRRIPILYICDREKNSIGFAGFSLFE